MHYWFVLLLLTSFLPLACFYLHFLFSASRYWSKRNIPHVKPIFLLGSFWEAGILENVNTIMKKIHLDNRDRKILGYWMYLKPMLLVLDPEIIKRILIRDFNVFRERGMEQNMDHEALAGNLFMLKGKSWRNLRVKLTPTFTSGKMKMMFPTMMNCAQQLRKHLKKSADAKEPVEVKDLMARFTTDVISSVAFGIETNSLENPNSEFRKYGKKMFEMSLKSVLNNLIIMSFPTLVKMFKLRFVAKDISDFFIGAVKDTVEYRERHNVARNDFLQLLIQLMRAGKIEDVDRSELDGLTDEELVQKFSLNEAAAQCFLFFIAGFEASSSLLTCSLYELALNPDVQAKLQKEIDSALGDSEMTYEIMNKMQYLDMVVQESFRKYPPAVNVQRCCTTDYHIPELDVTIDKGTMITISVIGLHHDPQYYPKPELFDPERFSPEEKAKRDPMTYLPFGEGPRSCIGNRFALMQIKACLMAVMRHFTVHVCESTPIPIVLDRRSFMPVPKAGVPLIFKPRQ